MESAENVIIVILDSLRADRVGVLGGDRDLTPNIDDIGHNGVTFEEAYTCVNTTDPSVTSIHTGRYPRATVYHHGEFVTDEEKQRVTSCTRLPEILSEQGIETYATGYTLGRWNRAGFDEYAGTAREREAFLLNVKEKLQALNPRLYQMASAVYSGLTTIEDTFLTDNSHDDAVFALVDSVSGTEEPFYGIVHLMDTHMMYDASQETIAECLDRFDYPNQSLEEFFAEHSDSEFISGFVKDRVTDRDYEVGLARLLARYDASVIEADSKVGKLVDGLKAQDQWEDTSLFILADHGESLTEHGIYFDHHGLYDQTTHIPMIADIPGVEPQRRDEFVQTIDLYPTVLSLFGMDVDVPHDGENLLNVVEDDCAIEWRDEVFLEEAYTQRRTAVRTTDWKYITHRSDETLEAERGSSLKCGYCNTLHGAKQELYNLNADPNEEENCINDFPEVAANLEERIEWFERSINPPKIDNKSERVNFDDDDEVMEQLENLGYR